MNDTEYTETLRATIPLVISFLLFPAFCCILIIFGYVWIGFIIAETILGIMVISSFILRTKFLIKYPQYTTKKRFLFETLSYIVCLIFAVGTAFAVKDIGGVLTYYLFNIYIQPIFIIFVFVVMGFMISTSKKIVKAYQNEKERRTKK